MRAQFSRPLQDTQGNQIDEADIRVLVPNTTTLIAETLYADGTSSLTLTNPWHITDGEVRFYLENPQRVQVGVTVAGSPEEFWIVDVVAAATDSTHPGQAVNSMQVGAGAVAALDGSTAVGATAQATAVQSTAVGHDAAASMDQATAVGEQSTASQPGSVAVGASATADGSQAVALGNAASAPYDNATALGANAQASRPNQVMLGTADDYVTIPGTGVLTSPNGTNYTLAVTDDGQLYTQRLTDWVPVVEEPIPGH